MAPATIAARAREERRRIRSASPQAASTASAIWKSTIPREGARITRKIGPKD
jgi:hypothetical protein